MTASSSDPHANASRDLFFRVADRLQLEGCLHAVVQECKSVVLHCPSAALLEHYGQMLVQRLRQRLPDTSTEVFFPTHTDALIARFNTLLEHLSVDAATQLAGPCAPEKLWIVHDASALPEHELKLLLRLLQHFPGARISTVLMLGQWPEALRGVDPQARRFLRWDIEPPGQTQIDLFMGQARELGREVAALDLVSRVCAQATQAAPASAKPVQVSSTGAAGYASGTASASPAPTAAPRQVPPLAAATPPTRLRLPALGLVQWRTRLPQLWQSLGPQGRWAIGVLALLAFSAAMALWLQTPSRPAVSTLPSAQTSLSAAREAAAIETELPEAAQQGLAWLRVIGPGVYVVEHGLFASAQEAQKKIGNGRLYGARMLPHYRAATEAAQFMVITGPYPNEERARSFISRVDASAKPHPSATVLAWAQPQPIAPRTR